MIPKTTLATCLLLLNSLAFTQAQSADWQWVRQAGGQDHDEPNALALDNDGSLFLTGQFSKAISFGSYSLTGNGSWENFLVKYDPQGNVLWANSAGGSGSDGASDVGVDAEGNCYIAGLFNSAVMTIGDTTLSNISGKRDCFIAKYAPNGNVLWAKKISSSGDDGISAISVFADGALFVTGIFSNPTIDFDGIILTSNGGQDIFAAKIDPEGHTIWAQNYGGLKDEYPSSASTDGLGNAFVSGHFFSTSITFDTQTLTNPQGRDPFFIKISGQGDIVWAKSGSGAWSSAGYGVAADQEGNCYVGGSFIGDSILFDNVKLTGTSNYSNDMFLAKYNPDGQLVWAKNAVGNRTDVAYNISVDAIGGLYVTGTFSSDSLLLDGVKIYHIGDLDMFLAKYDTAGTAIWAKAVGGATLDEGLDVCADNEGHCYFTGHFSSPSIMIGNALLTNTQNQFYDILLAKYGNTSAAQEPAGVPVSEIFPNPGSGTITIQSTQPIDHVLIKTLDGKTILEQFPHQNRLELTIPQSGLVLAYIACGNTLEVKKIVIKH